MLGSGCVYPRSTQTLAGQLSAKHLTWRAYVQGIDEPGAAPGACAHPALGAADPTAEQTAEHGRVCDLPQPLRVLRFDPRLARMRHRRRWSGPAEGRPRGGEADAELLLHRPRPLPRRQPDALHRRALRPAWRRPNTFLKQVVPEITSSTAYKESGLLVITVDEAPSSGAFADSSSCCGAAAVPQRAVEDVDGCAARRGLSGGAAALAVRQGRHHRRGTVQPLLAAAHDRGPVRRSAPRLRGLPAVKSFEPAMFLATAKG